jgi:hypothetical protein
MSDSRDIGALPDNEPVTPAIYMPFTLN